MTLIRTIGVSAAVARAQTWDSQCPSLAGCGTYWSLTHTERKFQMWKGFDTSRGVFEAGHPLFSGHCCVAVVVSLSEITVRCDCGRDREMVTMQWTHMVMCFAVHLNQFLICGASLGAAKWLRNRPFPSSWDNIPIVRNYYMLRCAQTCPKNSTIKIAKST